MTLQHISSWNNICCTVKCTKLKNTHHFLMLHCHLPRFGIRVALLPVPIGSLCCTVTYPNWVFMLQCYLSQTGIPSCQNVALLPITPLYTGISDIGNFFFLFIWSCESDAWKTTILKRQKKFLLSGTLLYYFLYFVNYPRQLIRLVLQHLYV